MKFLATSAARVTSTAISKGKTGRADNGSVWRHNRIARCRRGSQSINDVRCLCLIGKLKLRGLKLSLKGLNLVLGDGVNNPLHSGGLVLNHITEAVVHGVLKDVGLRRHIVVDFSLTLFQIAAILLSYRLFILYICRFPRQFGLYLHPINDRSRVLVSRLLVIRPHSLVSEPSRLLLSDFIWLGC